MKIITTALLTGLLFWHFCSSAQISPSGEPRAQTDSLTGDVIILPVAYAPQVGQQTAALVFRNVAQRRTSILGQQRNGYYQMPYGHDWGAGARINRYNYALNPAHSTRHQKAGNQALQRQTQLALAVAKLAFLKSFSFGFGRVGL